MNDPRDFLERLVGHWRLTGKMGEVPLEQNVTAEWTLGDKFLVMSCTSTAPDDNPTVDYEAVYYLGYNEEQQVFVMHLLDTTEVPTQCVVGIGRRKGNSVPFLFQYEDTPLVNVFTWHPDGDRWRFLQTFEKDGEKRIFAIKEMIRVPAP